MMEEKTQELKKRIELIKQNTYENKNNKNTIPETLISVQENQVIIEEPIQRMERFGATPNSRPKEIRPCKFCGAPNWTPLHNCPTIETNCNKYGEKRYYVDKNIPKTQQ